MPRSPREAAILYAETRLEPWGKWSRDNPGTLGLPKVSIIHKVMRRRLIRGLSKRKSKLTARGNETLSFRPRVVGPPTDAVAEVDAAVAILPNNLQQLLKIEYIDLRNARVEDRCAKAGISPPTYRKRLHQAKYRLYVNLGGADHGRS
jgi:DNA-directed RNA polymerase specialized sigma24 family protein